MAESVIEVRFARAFVEPYGFPRLVAFRPFVCSRCGHAETVKMPVLIDWRDRQAAEAQRRAADGVPCAACGALQAPEVPLLQLRRGDGIGLLAGLPEKAVGGSEAWIRDTLIAAQADTDEDEPAVDLAEAAIVASVPLGWWGSVWNRPLAPKLLGALPLHLPASAEEAERWRSEAVALLGLPDLTEKVAAVLGAASKDDALAVIEAEPDLLESRWRLTVDVWLQRHLEAQPDAEAREVIENRTALIHQARAFGVAGVKRILEGGELLEAVRAAASEQDDALRLSALRVACRVPAPADSPLRVVAHNALMQALHGDTNRTPGRDDELIATGKEAVEIARDALGDSHDQTLGARLNLAVFIDERTSEHERGSEEAAEILRGAARTAALAGSPVLADVAVNLATVLARASGTFADRPESADELVKDAAHLRALLCADDQRTTLTMLIDEAAVARSKHSGSQRANAVRAVELLDQAAALEEQWNVLSAPEVALLAMNRSNAVTQLFEHSPDDVSAEEIRDRARLAIAKAAQIDRLHPVAIETGTNAGASLLRAYAALRDDPASLQEANDVLADALAAAKEAFPADHPVALRAALHLAAACGTAVDGELVDRPRARELLEWIVERATDPQFTMTAASNLAQMSSGTGDWRSAASGYQAASDAQAVLLAQARTQLTRLGVIAEIPDLTARRALALVLDGRLSDAVQVLEQGRARMRADHDEMYGADPVPAVLHLATCDYGTLGVLSGGERTTRGFASSLTSKTLKPLLAALLSARDRSEREAALDALQRPVCEDILEPVGELFEADPPAELVIVACGTLASCPLHVLTGGDGTSWVDRFTVRYRIVSASDAGSGLVLPAIGVFSGVPFAGADRDAFQRWAGAISEPVGAVEKAAWLLHNVPGAASLHLACHGECDPEDAMLSAFRVDGQQVTVAEIAELHTPDLGLVVAPACQSAAAGPGAPDELLGVAHALAHAGARTVVASLWDAEDATTSLVVARFYAELGDRRDAAASLAAAQRFVSRLTGPELGALAGRRLREEPDAEWLPRELALELSALSMHPDYLDPQRRCFGHPAQWGTLSCLEA